MARITGVLFELEVPSPVRAFLTPFPRNEEHLLAIEAWLVVESSPSYVDFIARTTPPGLEACRYLRKPQPRTRLGSFRIPLQHHEPIRGFNMVRAAVGVLFQHLTFQATFKPRKIEW